MREKRGKGKRKEK